MWILSREMIGHWNGEQKEILKSPVLDPPSENNYGSFTCAEYPFPYKHRPG